jgi:hypothetical protein
MKVPIEDISISRSAISTQGAFHMHVEFMGHKFDGWFDDFGGFLQATSDLATFIAVRTGKIKAKDARFTSSRDIAPGKFDG